MLLLWLSAPLLAWWISRPLVQRSAALSAEQTDFLRRLARRTWAFFDNFVTAEDNWLPPDNYQEYRAAAVARVTAQVRAAATARLRGSVRRPVSRAVGSRHRSALTSASAVTSGSGSATAARSAGSAPGSVSVR